MTKTTRITLEDFTKKAIQRYQDRKMTLDVEVEGFGAIAFSRPTENELLAYMNGVGKAVTADKQGNVISQDLGLMLDVSKDLVYASCNFLHDIELHQSLEVIDPLDVVTKIFGITKTMEIAGAIAEEFVDEEIENRIKN